MIYRILILAFIVISFGSCTTMYKSGQTPDDVYYSPDRHALDYVEVETERNGRFDNDEYYNTDRYLRMKSQSRNRWSTFDDDFSYWNNPTWNNPFYFNSFNRFNTPWGNQWGNQWMNPWMGNIGFQPNNFWNSGFNPFLPGFYSSPVVIVTKPTNPRAITPRGGSLNTYSSPRNATNARTGSRVYNISSTPRGSTRSGNTDKYYSTPRNRSYQYSNSGSSTPSRTFGSGSGNSSPSSTPRSSGSSSSGGSAPVRSFPRGGN